MTPPVTNGPAHPIDRLPKGASQSACYRACRDAGVASLGAQPGGEARPRRRVGGTLVEILVLLFGAGVGFLWAADNPAYQRHPVHQPNCRALRATGPLRDQLCTCGAPTGLDPVKVLAPMAISGFALLGLWTLFPGLVGALMGSPIRP
jgi:hypothetical protein